MRHSVDREVATESWQLRARFGGWARRDAVLFPGEALVKIAKKAARVLGDQLRSIDKARLVKKVCSLTGAELADVDEALRTTLAL